MRRIPYMILSCCHITAKVNKCPPKNKVYKRTKVAKPDIIKDIKIPSAQHHSYHTLTHLHPNTHAKPFPSLRKRRTLLSSLILLRIPLQLHLKSSKSQRNRLNGDQQNSQVQSRMALLAQGTPVWLLAHGHMAPPARPRGECIDRLGGIDGVKEDDCHKCCDKSDERRSEGAGCVC
jgi:hypothetical protein